jgi:hypothetical protein
MIILLHLTLMVFRSGWTFRNVKITSGGMDRAARNYQISLHGKHTADKIRTQLLPLYGDATYTLAIIYKWMREFRTWQTSIFDEPLERNSHPVCHSIANISVMLLLPRS